MSYPIYSIIEFSYLYPNGKSNNVELDKFLEMPTAERVKVTSEQYDLYCEMGTTFELCKICDDRDKNIKIEPCGHLLCAPCLTSWQVGSLLSALTIFSFQESESGNTCPFCRYEIKGTNKVIIDRFKPKEKEKMKEAKEGQLITLASPRPQSEGSRLVVKKDIPESVLVT